MVLNRGYPGSWADIVAEEVASRRYVRLSSGRLEIWVYMGAREDHLLVPQRVKPVGPRSFSLRPTYCSCDGFQLRLSSDHEVGCTHVVSFYKVARAGPLAPSVKVSSDEMAQIIMEILTLGRSVSLRRAIANMQQDSDKSRALSR